MTRIAHLEHRFVKNVPRDMEAGVLYVSLEYCTMIHQCACGCGRKIVTPISPNDWKFSFDGKSITVHPSIGSWSLPCRSHYFIRNSHIQWAGDWTDEQIKRGRVQDLSAKRPDLRIPSSPPNVVKDKSTTKLDTKRQSFIQRICRNWFGT